MNRSLIFFSTIECWWAWLDLKNGLGTKKQPNILFLITMKHNLIFFSDFNFLILSHSVLIPTFINYIYQMVRQPIYISHMPLVSFSPNCTSTFNGFTHKTTQILCIVWGNYAFLSFLQLWGRHEQAITTLKIMEKYVRLSCNLRFGIAWRFCQGIWKLKEKNFSMQLKY